MREYQLPSGFSFHDSDLELQQAYEQARTNFRYLWREIAWDRRRIVPALGLACFKAPFVDPELPRWDDGAPKVEHMWLSEVDFDGQFVRGVLSNDPNWVRTVRDGDKAQFRISEISDWMYVVGRNVYGGFSVGVLRSRMNARERREHDEAWELNFHHPPTVQWVSDQEQESLDEAFAESLKEQLAKTPSLVSAKGHNGWTLLHQDASAGSKATVRVLLEAGADPNLLTDQGMTARQLANALGWDAVAELLAGT